MNQKIVLDALLPYEANAKYREEHPVEHEALKRMKAEKMTINKTIHMEMGRREEAITFSCPRCDKILAHHNGLIAVLGFSGKYCPECGQRVTRR